jgi:hypothetical protein
MSITIESNEAEVKSLHIGRAIAECLTAEHALNKFFRGDCIADIPQDIFNLTKTVC